jgi:ubiquinone biosynthesis protein
VSADGLRHWRVYRALRTARVVGPALASYRFLEMRDTRRGAPDLAAWERVHARTARGIAALGEDLGGLSVKLCQVAGARADVFPAVFVRELGRFHDRVTPRPFAALRPTLERDLGRPLAECFDKVEEAPLAAASLAQVHRAWLRDGTPVVIKIQYPEAARLFAIDLGNVRRAAAIASRVLPGFAVREPVEEIAHFVALELDFVRERESLDRVARALAGVAGVRVPRAIADLCGQSVLVLEYLDGIPIHELDRLRAAGFELGALADRVAALYRGMLFEQGFFHGDPHPGNLLVMPGGEIGLLDFGLAKELPKGFAGELRRMFASAALGDAAGAVAAARALGFTPAEGAGEHFVRALGIALGARHDLTVLRELFDTRILGDIPRDIALVIRTLILLNGLSERLAPGERRIARALLL